MKFSREKVLTKKLNNGLFIDEYCPDNNPYPIDGAVAHFRNGSYPWKQNKEFYELFFILEGTLTIEFKNSKIILEKGDVFIVEPNKSHTIYADFADVFIACTPPFDVKNVILDSEEK